MNFKAVPEELSPLSYYEEALFFFTNLAPTAGLYNIPSAWVIEGQLDPERLRKAVQTVARRHVVLSSVILSTESGDVARSRVNSVPIDMPILLDGVDLAGVEARQAANAFANKPFDLRTELPIRIAIIRANAAAHLFIVVVHHLVADARSLEIICREIGLAYGGALPASAVDQYTEFATAQRGPVRAAELEESRRYWTQRLAGMPSESELPRQRPRPAQRRFAGKALTFAVGKATLGRLQTYCKLRRATPAIALLAGYRATIYRHTQRDDFVIGMPVSGRATQSHERMVGLFVNQVAIRTPCSGGLTFAQCVEGVQSEVFAALDHHGYPFPWLVRDLGLSGDLSREPVTQATFNFVTGTGGSLHLVGHGIRQFELDILWAKNDFALEFLDTGDELKATVVFDGQLYEEWYVEQFYQNFACLLDAGLANPDAAVRDLPIFDVGLAGRYRRQVSTKPTTSRPLVHELIAQQVRNRKDAVAIACDGTEVTFGGLGEQAEALGQELQRCGAKPDICVAVCLRRSPLSVISLLAVLKAGSAYLPLDPEHPTDRLRYMVRDSGAPIVLVDSSTLERLEGVRGVLNIHQLDLDEPRAPRSVEPNILQPGHLAYCIYTSGSTGKPKAVAISHLSLTGHIRDCIDLYHLDTKDRVLQFASLSFDASIEQILSTLAAGATIVMRGQGIWSPDELARKIRDEHVTVAQIPPAYWNQYEDPVDGELDAPSMRLLLLGGEAAISKRLGRARFSVLNPYGPTEATVTSTIFIVPRTGCDGPYLPIGHGLPNTATYVLDSDLCQVPDGVVGELHIAGHRLARGYWGRGDLTAEKFIPDPFGEPGSRMYRTGDLVRRLPDGNLCFVARSDRQVKIRGYRIELGEVESCIRDCDGVREIAVISEQIGNTAALIAYVVGSGTITTDGIRAAVRRKLPEYMVPSAFVFLESLPLTINGKVDFAALPRPAQQEVGGQGEHVAPRNPIEARLVRVWADVLGREQVGIHDDFFALGGHSLLATKVLNRAAIPALRLRDIFDYPTIAALSEQLLNRSAASRTAEETATLDSPRV